MLEPLLTPPRRYVFVRFVRLSGFLLSNVTHKFVDEISCKFGEMYRPCYRKQSIRFCGRSLSESRIVSLDVRYFPRTEF